jgi:YEATS domain-containing protein 4
MYNCARIQEPSHVCQGLEIELVLIRRTREASVVASPDSPNFDLHLQSHHAIIAISASMPAPTSKRIRGLKLTRHFIIGNEAHVLPHPDFPDPPPDGHGKGWKVYVRPLPNGPDITTWLKKVQFKLHHTYADASRTIEAPGPFEVTETGYGEFGVEIRLYFAQESGEKAVYREHYLVLGAYGSDEQRQRQERENKIVAERLETIEFNEPTADFLKLLTSEDQFNWLKVKKGRGKGKKPEFVFEGNVEPTAKLPEKPADTGAGGLGSGGAWSGMYEKQVLAQLEQSRKALDEMLEEEKKKMEERRKKMEEVGARVVTK